MSPDVIADTIFKASGRCIVRDQGYFSIGTKLLLKTIDWNFMGELAPLFMKSNPDFRKLKEGVVDKVDKEWAKVQEDVKTTAPPSVIMSVTAKAATAPTAPGRTAGTKKEE